MPETPEELYERAKDGLRMPPVEEWDTFPFAGDMRPRPIEPPTEIDRPRLGAGGVDCSRCAATDDRFLWTDEHWRVFALPPSGLPLVAMLESREHYAEPGRSARSGGCTSAVGATAASISTGGSSRGPPAYPS